MTEAKSPSLPVTRGPVGIGPRDRGGLRTNALMSPSWVADISASTLDAFGLQTLGVPRGRG